MNREVTKATSCPFVAAGPPRLRYPAYTTSDRVARAFINPTSHAGPLAAERPPIEEIVVELKGKGAYSRLKHEAGPHRVQRVPETESQGRIHTSTATVAVLPEAEDVDVEIRPDDIEVDVFRSSGPGGQSVNTTDSAVRITHKPTGIVV